MRSGKEKKKKKKKKVILRDDARWRAPTRAAPAQRAYGFARLRLAAAMPFTLPMTTPAMPNALSALLTV